MVEGTQQLNICHRIWLTIKKQSKSCRISVRCLLRVCLMEVISVLQTCC